MRILDPHQELLERWNTLTTRIGMSHLRSGSSHSLGADFHELRRFAAAHPRFGPGDLVGRYRRPSLSLFNAHAQHLLEWHELESLHLQAEVTGILRRDRGYLVESSNGDIESLNVVLALGTGDRLRLLPGWPRAAGIQRVQHSYQPAFVEPDTQADLLVVGGGISALQFACSRAERRKDSGASGRVTLVHPAPLKVGQFDAEACYMGPACMDGVRALPASQRHPQIDAGRRPGQVPPDLAEAYQQALDQGLLQHIPGRVVSLSEEPGVILQDGRELRADFVVAATGFRVPGPGPELIGVVSSRLGLPCSDRGYPLLSPDLQWGRGIYACGPAAELELGPMAGNLLGAMHAARRILAGAQR